MAKVDEGDIADETMKEFEDSRRSPKIKNIVVHPELYQRLLLDKASLAMKWAKNPPEGAPSTPTFADVIVEWGNERIWFGQLISRIIREHPEVKSIIAEVAKKDPEHYKLVISRLGTL